MDEQTMKLGLLMEAAQANQKSAEASVKKLRGITNELAGQIRADVQQVVQAALQLLEGDCQRATEALRDVRRAANVRLALWSVGISALSSAIPLALLHGLIPSAAEIAALRLQYGNLRSNITTLEQRGGRAELKHCGDSNRLCVRIDRSAPSYGEKADYLVIKGY
jgi:hypothetical protein